MILQGSQFIWGAMDGLTDVPGTTAFAMLYTISAAPFTAAEIVEFAFWSVFLSQ